MTIRVAHALIGAVLLVAWPRSASAQLGANEVQVRARYGPPRKIDDWIEPDERQTIYLSHGYAIGTSFVRGLVSRISNEHTDGSPLAATEIGAFLHASSQGSEWHQDTKDVWSRADRKAMVRLQYRANSGGVYAAVLHIYSLTRYDPGPWFTNPPGT